MFWQASAACASCGASVLVRPWPGLTATRLACTAGWGAWEGGRGGWGGGRGGLGERAQAALALPQRAYIGDGRPPQGARPKSAPLGCAATPTMQNPHTPCKKM